jgi:hypothetical protein
VWKEFFSKIAESVAKGLENSGRSYAPRGPSFKDSMQSARNRLRDAVIAFQSGRFDTLGFASACDAVASEVREIGDDCSSKRDNMPEALQDCGTGELLGIRADECNAIAEALEDASRRIRGIPPSARNEAAEAVMQITWDYS